MCEVPKQLTQSRLRSFGKRENTFFIEVLKTAEAKEQALDLILQKVFQADPNISVQKIMSDQNQIVSNPESKGAFKDWVIHYLDENIVIGCYSYSLDTKKLKAVDVLNCRQFRASPLPEDELMGEAYGNFKNCLNIIHQHVQAKYRKIDQHKYYLAALGVFTKENSLEIHKEMIFVRKRVARDLGIEVIASAFIGKEMQGVAESLNYKDLKVLNREEMLQLGQKESSIHEGFPTKIMGFEKKNRREINTRKITKTKLRKKEVAGTVKVLSKPFLQPPLDDSE